MRLFSIYTGLYRYLNPITSKKIFGVDSKLLFSAFQYYLQWINTLIGSAMLTQLLTLQSDSQKD